MVMILRLSIALLLAALALAGHAAATTAGAFRDDDPLAREPDTQDASGVREWEIDLFIDLAINMFGQPGDEVAGVRAGNVNTIDEVPDSSWFTNRIAARPVSIAEAVRGPRAGDGPAAGIWTVVAAKAIGAAPGFTVQDSTGETWYVSFDARGYPEAATGAILVANRIFWTLGYWQADNVLTRVRPADVVIGDTATIRVPSGSVRRMRSDDLAAVWDRAHRSPDGTYRAVAARQLPGRPLGGFRYYGTRPDDPNDVVPHEHRRELRALRVFGAWTNLVDIKAGNTLDVLVTENGRASVRHYLQDVGSTFGTGANAPREYDEGWEHLYEGDRLWKRLVSLGFYIRPWQTVDYREHASVGRFEGVEFDPTAWKPRVPAAALRHAQPDDLFWAARRVAAFSDEMIRALVGTAEFSDPAAAQLLADVLIQRRAKIAAAYLPSVHPLVDVTLSSAGQLSFRNAAAVAGVTPEPRGGYHVSWAYFDNITRAITPIGESALATTGSMAAPAPLSSSGQRLVCVRVTAIDPPDETWAPVRACFRAAPPGWRLVGLDRSGR
jgi:hypothetical protein